MHVSCPYCDHEPFETRAGLARHIAAKHPQPAEDELAERIEEGMGYGEPGSYAPDDLPGGKPLVPAPEPETPATRPPNVEETRQIRSLMRTRFATFEAAYAEVMGFPCPPKPVVLAGESRHLEHVRFRVRNSTADGRDARFLLALVDVGSKAIDRMDPSDPVVAEWVGLLL